MIALTGLEEALAALRSEIVSMVRTEIAALLVAPNEHRDGPSGWVSTRDAARHCGVKEQRIREWVSTGKLEAGRTPGGQIRLRIADLDRAFRQSTVTSTESPDAISANILSLREGRASTGRRR